MAGRETGFGLANIRERLGLFGGRLALVSRSGEGTQVTVTILLTPTQSQAGETS